MTRGRERALLLVARGQLKFGDGRPERGESHTCKDKKTNNQCDRESDEASSDWSEVRLGGELFGQSLITVGKGHDVAAGVCGVVASVAPRSSIG